MDLTKEPIQLFLPHYTCGGVVVDDYGRADVDGLYAIGEVSSRSLHGANRKRNSLLECPVYGTVRSANGYRRANAAVSTTLTSFPHRDESRVENADERVW